MSILRSFSRVGLAGTLLLWAAPLTQAEPPGVAYIFPAGGQRGTTVSPRVGGFYFHGKAQFHCTSNTLQAAPQLKEMQTLFFDGPLILKPASQQREDYPKDYAAQITIPADAPLGSQFWWCSTSQGVTPRFKFVVGELPEVIETEVEGPQDPTPVSLPVTINARIFPREDMDVWTFSAQKGQPITCELESRSLGYPLQAALEIQGPGGTRVPKVSRSASLNLDPSLSFVAPETGVYSVKVNDVAFGGGQQYVYRLSLFSGRKVEAVYPLGGRTGAPNMVDLHTLGSQKPVRAEVKSPAQPGFLIQRTAIASEAAGKTLSSPFPFHGSELPEWVRSADGSVAGLTEGRVALPAMLNGFISQPGEVHEWKVSLEANTSLQLEVLASALGSRLDSVLTLIDDKGKELAKNDDAFEGAPDAALAFTVPKTAEYIIRIQDRFSKRAGPDFAYRMRAISGGTSDFQLRLAADFYNAVRSEEPPATPVAADAKPAPKVPGIKLDVTSVLGTQGVINLAVDGLPEGATFEPQAIPAKAKTVELRFTFPPKTPLSVRELRVRGTMGEGAAAVTRTALLPGETPGDPRSGGPLRMAVVPKVPFQFIGEYLVNNDQPAGTTLTRTYRLERNGFEGPLTVCLSDKQVRCLQRVLAKPIQVAPGRDSFDYTIQYPTEVQLGWTSRVQIMAFGTFRDFDGSEHTLTYTSFAPDDQMISVVTNSFLKLSTPSSSFRADVGEVVLPIVVQRHDSLQNVPVQLSLKCPSHLRGVEATSVTIAGDQSEASLQIRIAPGAGPFNLPVEVFAQTPQASGGTPHSASLRIDLVPPAHPPTANASRSSTGN